MSPELEQDPTDPENPASLPDEDSEDDEEDGPYCDYCGYTEDGHEMASCLRLRDETAEVQRTFVLDSSFCTSCLGWEEDTSQHICEAQDTCKSCSVPHHAIFKCEAFSLTQPAEHCGGAPQDANPPTRPTNQQRQKRSGPIDRAKVLYTTGLQRIRRSLSPDLIPLFDLVYMILDT